MNEDKKRKSKSEPASEIAPEAEEAFVRGVVTRGEAAEPEEGKLPSGATHEIVESEESPPRIRRKRFSAS